MKPDAAGAATAAEAIKFLEAELYPKPVAPSPTNAMAAAIAPTNRVVAMTNRTTATAHTNVAAVRHDARTNLVATAPTNAPTVTTKPIALNVATNVPSPAAKTNVVATIPPPKTNSVALAPSPVTTNSPAPATVVEQTEPPKPLEVVSVDEEPKLAVAKDAAPVKPPPVVTTPKTVTRGIATPGKETNTVAAKEELPPLIRPARREEKEKAPSLTSSILRKANPVNWFRKDKSKEEEKPETVVAKRPDTTESTVKELPEPPKEAPKEPAPEVKPEPVFARYPYQTTLAPAPGKRAAAEPLFNEAVAAHQEGKLGKAMDGYRAALRQDPRYFDALLNLGIAAAQASDLSLALASLEDAVRMNPRSTDARYQFAMSLRRANYPLDAVNELKTLIEESPNEARAYLALANLYAQVLNKPDAAVTNYQRVLDLAPQHPQAPQIRAWLAQHG
jgi:Tfp pilus assembly protein PilF